MAKLTQYPVVIGANGFLGRALATQLTAHKNTRVIGVVRRQPTAAQRIPGVRYVRGDMTQPAFARRVARQASAIYYVAGAKENVAAHTRTPFTFYEQNIQPLLGFLNAIRTLPPRPIVYASSILAAAAARETSDGYLQGKATCEQALNTFMRQYNWPVKIVRLAAIYGPGQDTHPATANMIAALIQKARIGKKELVIWGRGIRKMQFIHITDAVANLIAAPRTTRTHMQVGHPEAVRINDIARLILHLLNKPLLLTHDRTKPDKPTTLFRFQNLIRPRITLRQGLKDLCEPS